MRKSLAIAIRKIDYSETSQILHFLTEDNGTISAIAKGAKRAKSSFDGPLDLYALYEILYIDKGALTLDILTASSLIDSFSGMRRNIQSFSAASYIAEFTGAVVAQGKQIDGYFPLVREILRGLDGGGEPERLTLEFEFAALRLTGFLPRSDQCVVCGKKAREIDTPFFSPRCGGALCVPCSKTAKGFDPLKVRIHHELLQIFSEFSERPHAVRERDIAGGELTAFRKIMNLYISCVMEREPRSMKYLV